MTTRKASSGHSGDSARVSVIIPTYNYGHFVLEAIKSAQSQSHRDIEIIVIDDGSTDDTESLLTNRADIVYVRQANQGLSAARNRGLDLASGKYVQFLDADDLLGPSAIAARIDVLERNPPLAFVACRSAFFRRSALPESIAFWHREWRQPNPQSVGMDLCRFNIAPPHAFLVRKSVIDELQLRFDANLYACEDYDFWLRLATARGLPAFIRSGWVYYRRHPNSMSRSHANQFRHDAELCRRVLGVLDSPPDWMTDRPAEQYLLAMLSGVVQTARRLWHKAPGSFADFFSSHLLEVLQRLERLSPASPAYSPALPYVAATRSIIARMAIRDRSVDRATFDRLAELLDFGDFYSWGALIRPHHQLTLRKWLTLVRHDLHYHMLHALWQLGWATAGHARSRRHSR